MKRIIMRIVLVSITLTITNCKKWDIENYSTLKKLYKEYENGEICECKYEGEIVYCACIDASDAAAHIYDYEGNEIGICNWAWGTPDSICYQLEDCELIYRNAQG